MNKKMKIGLGVSISALTLTGVGAGLGVYLTQDNQSSPNEFVSNPSLSNGIVSPSVQDFSGIQESNSNVANGESTVANGESTVANGESTVANGESTVANDDKVATFSVRTLQRAAQITDETTFLISIKNLNSKLGEIEFTDAEGIESFGETLIVKPNEQVFVKAKKSVEGFTLYSLDVSCVGNESYTLETNHVGTGVFSFKLPSTVGEDGRSNPFYNGTTKIEVKATFAESFVSEWEYNFNKKAYTYTVTSENFVLDDLFGTKDLTMRDISESNMPVNYMLDLNGYDIEVGTYTVPKGCNLIIYSSSKTHQKQPRLPIIQSRGNGIGKIQLGGVLTKYDQTFEISSDTRYGVVIDSFYQMGVNDIQPR